MAVALSQPAQRPPLPKELELTLWAQARSARDFTEAFKAQVGKTTDKKYADVIEHLWFLDFRTVPEKDLGDWILLVQWWLNQMSFEQAPAYLNPVPNNPRLFWVDIRDYRWNKAARNTVGSRDPYSQQQWANQVDAQYLRDAVGAKVPDELQKKDRYPLIAVVNAPWLFRETVESDRSQSYYDLLYAAQRFGDDYKAPVKFQGETKAGPADEMVYVQRGSLTLVKRSEVKPGEKVYVKGADNVYRQEEAHTERTQPAHEESARGERRANFPATVKDWEEAFGLDLLRAFGKKVKVSTNYGTVVEGALSNPGRGSIVALNDRFVVTEPSGFGSIAMRTFDVFENEGRRDFIEQAPKLPFEFDRGTITFDAGELLAYLPNGGQAALLIDGKGNRAEIAATKAAFNSLEKKPNPGVRNPGDCVTCHGAQGGYILPRSLLDAAFEKGVDLKIKDREVLNRFKGFYEDWADNVAPYAKKYESLLAKTTRDRLKRGDKGWDGAKLEATFRRLRDQYDAPISPATAALDTGYPVEVVKAAAAKSNTARLNMLNRDMTIPRRTWEFDAYRNLQNLIHAERGGGK